MPENEVGGPQRRKYKYADSNYVPFCLLHFLASDVDLEFPIPHPPNAVPFGGKGNPTTNIRTKFLSSGVLRVELILDE